MAGEDDAQREGAVQPLERGGGRLLGRHALGQVEIDQLRHHLGVGVAFEALAGGGQFRLQFRVILDDAVMHHRHARGGVRVGVALVGNAVRGPAGVADADAAGQRVGLQQRFQIGQLALGAAALDPAIHQGGDAGRVIAAIFQPTQSLDQRRGDLALANDADDAAHVRLLLETTEFTCPRPCRRASSRGSGRPSPKVPSGWRASPPGRPR